MKSFYFLILFIAFSISNIKAQSNDDIEKYFSEASARYNVPAALLKSIAFYESRFQNRGDQLEESCNGMPSSFGVMGLRDDNWFGNSLVIAASYINLEPSVLKSNTRANILGAAAYLNAIAVKEGIQRENINNWKRALEIYSGIPQRNIVEFYSFDVLKTIAEGLSYRGITITADPNTDLSVFGEEINPKNKLKNIESDDYGPAVWSPSPNFTTGSINHQFSVVHVTQGGFAGSVSWLQNPQANASSHYVIRSSDGYIVQLVREQNKAWHAVCWNGYMLGVEHEGYVDNPAWFTDAMYISSAALYRHFADRWSIPINRNRIVGHNEWQNSAWVSWMSTNFPSISPSCNNHTDPGQYWDWNFYLQLISQDTTKPKILSYQPASSTDSIFSNAPVKIKFDQRMKRNETQAAFTITPQTAGSFTWEDNGRTMVFKPSAFFSLGQTYNVTLDTSAVNYVGQKITSGINFSFVTKTYSSLNLLSTYPENGNNSVSSTVKIIIAFDTPINQTTLAGAITLNDSAGIPLAIKNIQYKDVDNKGYISFTPSLKLNPSNHYELRIKGSIKNIFNAPLGDSLTVKFRTEQNNFIQGNMVDDLELIKNWKDPNYSGSTVGTDPNGTTFSIVNEEISQGAYSGKINYVFTGVGGVCRTFDGDKPSIGSTGTDLFGMWVYGDLSYNILEYWFYYNSSTNTISVIDTLDWTGWKFLELPVSAIGGSGVRLFHSVVIRQTNTGAKTGAIYIDGIQVRPLTPTGLTDLTPDVYNFSLSQNYPNPFNPETNIEFAISESGNVNISIYNILGDKVAELLNEKREAGRYSIVFDSGKLNLSSGVYFYTLKSGLRTQSRKMLVLK